MTQSANKLIQIIEQQQEEKITLLSKTFIPRQKFRQIQSQLDTALVKVIIGPRRAGKSLFAINALRDKDFLYLNFDNRELLSEEFSTLDFLNALKTFKKKYLFLDEVQNLKDFELLINTLQRNGYLLTISGSNSNLLSGELASHLTGRFISVEILPFNLSELSGAPRKFTLDELNQHGLYPDVIVEGVDSMLYLSDLYKSIIYKDIIQRFKIRAIADFEATAHYLLSNIGTRQSFTAISKKLNIPSLSSISKYTSFLTTCYLIIPIKKFSFKVSETIKNPRKYYCIDNGMINAVSKNFSQNMGRLLENQVLLELMKSGISADSIYYFIAQDSGAEVDFLVKLPGSKYLAIQVCVTLLDDSTRLRELRGLTALAQELQPKGGELKQILIVGKIEGYKEPGIEILTLQDFAANLERLRGN